MEVLFDMKNFLKKYLKEIINEVISEGLIKTFDITNTLTHMNNWGTLEDNINFDNYGNNTIRMCFHEATWEQINYSIEQLNTYGWFPSKIFSYKNEKDYDTNKNKNSNKYSEVYLKNLLNTKFYVTYVIFEAKFDMEVIWSDLPQILYHISPKFYFDKIKKLGICPKTQNKLSTYPDRIYLGLNKDGLLPIARKIKFLKYTKEKNNDKYENAYINDFIIYPISKDSLRRYKFYKDPNASEFGIYVLSNIPPTSIDFENCEEINLKSNYE